MTDKLKEKEEFRYAPIGVFDSGVGGLTVAREIMRQIPKERIIYFGDTARVPYGSKSKETIIRFSRQIIRFLQSKGVKAIVIACNTASALALETVQPEFDIPILGVVLGKPCPLFVPLVEEGWLKDPVTVEVANRYLEPLLESGIDTLIMGCTHYPLLRSTLRQIMGEKVNLVNPAYETARELKSLLERDGLNNDGKQNYEGAMHEFYVSDAANKFKNFANSILPYGVDTTQLIHIEDY